MCAHAAAAAAIVREALVGAGVIPLLVQLISARGSSQVCSLLYGDLLMGKARQLRRSAAEVMMSATVMSMVLSLRGRAAHSIAHPMPHAACTCACTDTRSLAWQVFTEHAVYAINNLCDKVGVRVLVARAGAIPVLAQVGLLRPTHALLAPTSELILEGDVIDVEECRCRRSRR